MKFDNVLERIGNCDPNIKQIIYNMYSRVGEVHLESSSNCNGHCIMCPNESMDRYKGVMGSNVFDKCLEGLSEISPSQVTLHLNGEPLFLGPSTMVNRISKITSVLPDTHVVFFTNGSLLDDEYTEKIINSKLNEIGFSVDGGNAVDFENVRRGLKFDVVVNNIKHFCKQNKLNGNRIKTRSNIVPQVANRGSIKSYFELMNDIGIDSVGGSGIQNIGGLINAENMRLPEQCTSGNINNPCIRIFNNLCVMADGKCCICCQDVIGSTVVGDVNDNTLKEIWQSDLFWELRIGHLLGDKKGMCNSCDYMLGVEMPSWWKILN